MSFGFGLSLFRFLPGIVLAQASAAGLVLLFTDNLTGWDWLKLVVVMMIVALVVAGWFASLAKHLNQDEIASTHAKFAREREKFAREREKILVGAEKAKTKIVQQSQRKITQETNRATKKANMKVGAAFAGVVAAGGFLLFTQFLTVGLLAISAAGGGMAGYLTRLKQERSKQQALPGNNPGNTTLIADDSANAKRRLTLPGLGGKSKKQ